jgi:hypothetical protein
VLLLCLRHSLSVICVIYGHLWSFMSSMSCMSHVIHVSCHSCIRWFFFSRHSAIFHTDLAEYNSFRCLLRRLPRPQDVGYLCLRYFKFFNPFHNLNCSARERAPWRRVTEKSHFSALNVGLAGTGNQTQATCLAGSITRRSATHYAFVLCHSCIMSFMAVHVIHINSCHLCQFMAFISIHGIHINSLHYVNLWHTWLG